MIDKERQRGRVHSRPFGFIWVHDGSQDRNSQLVLTRNRKPRLSLERHTPDHSDRDPREAARPSCSMTDGCSLYR